MAAFGDVVMGTMRATGVKVAVKTCKDTVPDPARFLEEAECLKDYDHPNIVKLVGVVSSKPIYIVLELCTGGELLDFLRKGGHDVAMHVKMSGEVRGTCLYLCPDTGVIAAVRATFRHRTLGMFSAELTELVIMLGWLPRGTGRGRHGIPSHKALHPSRLGRAELLGDGRGQGENF